MPDAQEVENLRFKEEQFIRVAALMGWVPETKIAPWAFIEARYKELMDLHDLVKKQAVERRKNTE